MDKIALVVPVYKNFEGFAELMESVDVPVVPIVIPNWKNNIGVGPAWNVGLLKSIIMDCEYTLICNDDIVLDAGTIEKLVSSMDEKWFDMVTAVNHRDAPVTEETRYDEAPDFSCFMVRPYRFVTKFGYFDESFAPAYFEDNDMHYRIKVGGGTAVCRTDAGMLHRGSVTQNWGGQPVVDSYMFEKNRQYYGNKWGGWPGYEAYTQPWNGEK